MSVKIVAALLVFGLYRLVCTSTRSCADVLRLVTKFMDSLPSHAIVRYKLDGGQLDDKGFYGSSV